MRRLILLVFLLAAACGSSGERPPGLRFSVIPDWNKGRLQADAERLARHLAERLGVPVHYQPSNDYVACVNGLIADKLDFAWLGGKTTVDAIDAGSGAVHVLATRDIDLRFKSYFVGHHTTIQKGLLAPVEGLAELRSAAAGLRLSFGEQNSTSGHLMPRHYLTAAGLDPERDFLQVAYATSHSGTLQAVADGSVDLGALNYAYYDKADAALKQRAPVLWTTPEYVDYAWVAHDRIGSDLRDRLREALLALSTDDETGRAILGSWSAGAFVAAGDEQWQAIRAVRDALPKGFLK
jgi:phosphonate transport system substrate-binding protein